MAFVPASFEIVGYIVFAPMILGVSRVEAAVMGAVLGAVSPAVVVPRMVGLMEKKYGTKKAIPQMILAGASCDDIFVIVLFTTFLSMAQGGSAHVMDFVNIPISIVLGVLLGAVVGYALYLFFETAYARKHCVRNSMKVIIVLGFSFLLIAIRGWLGRKSVGIRSAGSCQHGVRLEVQKYRICIQKIIRKIWQALACSGSCVVCACRCGSGHPLYAECRTGGGTDDCGGTCLSCSWCAPLRYRDTAFLERANLLRDRLSA